MKFYILCAILIVILDCVGKAVGQIPQSMFSTPHAWIWWIVAVGWFLIGIDVCKSTITR